MVFFVFKLLASRAFWYVLSAILVLLGIGLIALGGYSSPLAFLSGGKLGSWSFEPSGTQQAGIGVGIAGIVLAIVVTGVSRLFAKKATSFVANAALSPLLQQPMQSPSFVAPPMGPPPALLPPPPLQAPVQPVAAQMTSTQQPQMSPQVAALPSRPSVPQTPQSGASVPQTPQSGPSAPQTPQSGPSVQSPLPQPQPEMQSSQQIASTPINPPPLDNQGAAQMLGGLVTAVGNSALQNSRFKDSAGAASAANLIGSAANNALNVAAQNNFSASSTKAAFQQQAQQQAQQVLQQQIDQQIQKQVPQDLQPFVSGLAAAGTPFAANMASNLLQKRKRK